MLIYIIVAVSLLIFAILSEIKYFRHKKIFQALFLICGCTELFIVSGFRLNTGMDYPAYVRFFNGLIGKSVAELAKQRMEKGYVLLNRYIQLFTNDFRALFIIVALIVSVILGVILYKYCKNPSLGLLTFYLLGFYFNSMNFVRAMLAALIILFAYKYIKDKQFLRFTAIILLASTFHLSALLMIPFYFILNIKFNYITLGIFSFFGGLIFLFSTDILELVTKYVYTIYSPETSFQIFKGIPIAYSLFIFIILLCSVLLKKDIEQKSGWGTILIWTIFFDFYFGFIGFKHSILSRFALYFGPIMALILVPFIIRLTLSKIKNKSDEKIIYKIRTYFCLIAVSLSSAAFFAYSMYGNYNNVIPHEWIWNLK